MIGLGGSVIPELSFSSFFYMVLSRKKGSTSSSGLQHMIE
jgi:hypothetical protein